MTLALLSAATPIHAEAPASLQIRCADGRGLSLRVEEERAIASFEGRRLILPRQPFPIGAYYRSDEGALIIDGRFVAFVPANDPTWRECEIKGGR